MVEAPHRFPLLQRLLGRRSRRHDEVAALLAASQAQERRVQALNASLDLLTNTLQASADGVLAIDFSSGISYCNPRFTDIWGPIPPGLMAPGQEAALRARHAQEVKDPVQFMARAAQLQAAPGEETLDEIEMKDGRILERHVAPRLVNGTLAGVVTSYRDITGRSRADREILFNRLVVENSGPLFWIDPVQRRVVYANKAACEQLSYPIEELMGMEITALDVDASSEAATRLKFEVGPAGKPKNFESRFGCGDGRLIDVEISLFEARDEERSVIVLSFKDTTEQKNATDQAQRE